MQIKIGRNDKCPCGSGKKYKKCCFLLGIDPIKKLLSQSETGEQGGLLTGRPIINTEFEQHRVVAVGSRIYPQLPINVTFHQFIIIFLKDILGTEWGTNENKKPIEDQHILVKWLNEMGQLFRDAPHRVEDVAKDIKSVEPTGNVQSLLAFAYDIYSVYHCANLPDELMNRIKNEDQFQGAKYEIAVAAIFVRAGFKIDWLPKSEDKHGEFVATHKKSGEKIVVEAKSRHRMGVLTTPGIQGDLTKVKTEVTQLFNKALKKSDYGLPFMIFIDINLPLTDEVNPLNRKWVDDIRKMLEKYNIGTIENPDKFTTLFITNFSWHYYQQSIGIKKSETVTIIPLFPKNKLINQNTITLLHRATEEYGIIPPMFPQ